MMSLRQPAKTSATPKASWPKAALRIIISTAFLVLLFYFIPFHEVLTAMKRLSPAVWCSAIIVYLCLHLIGVAKWRLLVNTAGAGLGFLHTARAYYAGLFGNTFLPSIVGGDVVRAGVAFKYARSKAALLFGSFIDRILDFIGLLLVAGIGALLAPRALDPQSRQIFIAVAAILTALCVGGVVLVAMVPVRRFKFKLRRKMVQVRRAIRAVSRRPSAVVGALLMGMLLQTLLVVLNAWLGHQAGIDIPFYVWLFVWPLAKMSGIAPTQNGIGVREAAQVALFAPFGVPAGLALATGLIFEVTLITGGLIGGVIALAIGRFTRAPAPAEAAAEI